MIENIGAIYFVYGIAATLLLVFLKMRTPSRILEVQAGHLHNLQGQVAAMVKSFDIRIADKDKQIEHLQKLNDRLMVKAGIILAEPTKEDLEEKNAAAAEDKRLAGIIEKGGDVFGS